MSIGSVLSETKARYGLEISGSIELKLIYISSTGALDISIIRCTNLARAKRNQTSDPFVFRCFSSFNVSTVLSFFCLVM